MLTYKCPNGHTFDLYNDTPFEKLRCPICGSSNIHRKYQPTPVIFRGKGFYKTEEKKK